VAATLLAGCAPSQTLTKSDRDSLRAVSVSKEVVVPNDVFLHGPAQNVAGALGGALGALVGLAMAEEPKAQLKAAMKTAQIDVAQIVREQFAPPS
jgi:outer membrane lipoprotein SlyB